MSLRTFYWCSGQDDNLGDVVLRRRMLRALQGAGPVVIYVGRASQSFTAGLGPRPVDTVLSTYRAFLAALLVAAVRGEARFAFNPGEIRCVRRQVLMHVALLPGLAVVRLRGRAVIRMGVGTRDHTPVGGGLIGSTTRFGTNLWRDEFSRAAFGRGDVAPDWAFADGPDPAVLAADTTPRRQLAVSLRSDLPVPGQSWVDGVRSAAEHLGLTPVVVTQVQRDDATDRRLAERLGCEHVGWPDGVSHLEQERKVRAVHRRCAAVLSDRLHVLVLGLTEGATPVGVVEHANTKVRRHFDVVGLTDIAHDARAESADTVAQEIIRRAARDVSTQRRAARARVDDLDDLVLDLFGLRSQFDQPLPAWS